MALLTITELKPGKAITLEGQPYIVIESQFGRKSQSKANMQCKLKNLKTGAIIARNFQGSEKVEAADVGFRHVQYLYGDERTCTFMDLETYDQFPLPKEMIGNAVELLVGGAEVDAMLYDGTPIGLTLPSTMVLKVVETVPGVRGDTATGSGKPAKLETGLTVTVPFFIREGDKIRVNTETLSYVERVI
jgi:elongation factor P